GDWAEAGAAARGAAEARHETKNRLRMRLERMDQNPRNVCDDVPYLVTMCPNLGAPQHCGKFLHCQTHQGESRSGWGTRKLRFRHTFACRTVESEVFRYSSVFGVGQARRFGGEFLVLRGRREAVVGLGVKDHVSEQFLAERGQRALPELARGL